MKIVNFLPKVVVVDFSYFGLNTRSALIQSN